MHVCEVPLRAALGFLNRNNETLGLKTMGLFGFGDDEEQERFTQPVDPNWVHARSGGFFPLLYLDPEEQGLIKVGGIYLIWHTGVHPEWVYAGHTNDLASALHHAGNNPDINYYEKNGGLFVAWAPVIEKYRPGVVKYLQTSFKTLISNSDAFDDKTVPVPVTAPLAKKKEAP